MSSTTPALPASGQPRPIPKAREAKLDALSESSVGSWERGKVANNARSPPSAPSILIGLDSSSDASARPSYKQQDKYVLSSKFPHSNVGGVGGKVNTRVPPSGSQGPEQKVIYPRTAREGYGFRPASGASTPTGTSTGHQLGSSLGVGSDSREEVSNEIDDQEATIEDRQDEEFNEQFKKALKGIGGQSGTSDAGSSGYLNGSSIADEEGLGWPAKSTHIRLNSTEAEKEANLKVLAGALRTVLECIGEDPDREGLQRTPERYAKALMWMTKGYEERLVNVINDAVFAEDHEEMVIVRDIDIFSLCEHHLVPFTGTISIGYIPNKLVLGLSKLARIAETFARRLQVQERLTRQVAETVMEAIKPRGVAVVMEASHMCMSMRGVQKPGATTVTSTMLGCFRDQQKTREEFLTLIRTPSMARR